MNDDFIAWLYCQVQYQVCEHYEDCIGCPFRNPKEGSKACNGLTADQKREILMKIYESEVEHWQGYGRTITAPKGTFDKIFNDEEGEE